MANTLEITDGTDTYNLWDGANYKVLKNGLAISPLQRAQSAVPDGSDLGMMPRTITIRLRVYATSKATLQTQIRNLEEMCENARWRWEERKVNTAVSLVQLNVQLGTTANADATFDVMAGATRPPSNYLDVLATETAFSLGTDQDPYIVELLVRPYALGAEVSVAADTLENEQNGALLNYQEITGVTGDAPARTQVKLVVAGETGTENVWCALRSGGRYQNTIWREGEGADSFVSVETDADRTIASTSQADTTKSADNVARARHEGVGASLAAEFKGYWSFTLSGPPRGLFRVLVMVKATSDVGGVVETTDLSFYAAWAYGNVSAVPTIGNTTTGTPVIGTSGRLVAADNTYEVMDLGVLNVLPVAEPSGESLSNFNLRIYVGLETVRVGANNLNVDWFLDSVFLVPIDEGMAVTPHVAADDLLFDSYTDPPGVYQLDAASGAVEDILDRDGSAFDLRPGNNRIYVYRDDVATATFATTITYRPRFRVV